MEFDQTQANVTLYGLKKDDKLSSLLAKVDGILIFSRTNEIRDQIFKQFAERFKNQSTKTNLFLYMSIIDDVESVKSHKEPMITRLFDQFNTSNCKPMDIPLSSNLNFEDHDELVTNQTPYRQLAGMLMYLTSTMRPNICYAVKYLSEFMRKQRKVL